MLRSEVDAFIVRSDTSMPAHPTNTHPSSLLVSDDDTSLQ